MVSYLTINIISGKFILCSNSITLKFTSALKAYLLCTNEASVTIMMLYLIILDNNSNMSVSEINNVKCN